MTLQVVVFINGRQIAEADASNMSDLADVSDYQCTAREHASKFGLGTFRAFRIEGHNRNQSCWALVEKIARTALSNSKGE